MSSIIASSHYVSRPKVHRLPVAPTKSTSEISELIRPTFSRNLVGFSAAAVIFTVLVASANWSDSRSGLVSVGEAMPVASARPSAEVPKKLIIQGESEKIIGQMAKMSNENKPVASIEATMAVDKSAGRELLSIVSKY